MLAVLAGLHSEPDPNTLPQENTGSSVSILGTRSVSFSPRTSQGTQYLAKRYRNRTKDTEATPSILF